ncbi:MAG: hypothetical protein GXO89_01930 [Chlorobi bacterium]|nr:hypothetical protein [Chlorobiota bacterium]
MKKIKIYGIENSGSIYLEWLIKHNLGAAIDTEYELGWKHRIAPSPGEIPAYHKQNTAFICLVKNPYTWMLSTHKRPYGHDCLKKLKFGDFIRFSYGDYQNPVVLWNKKNTSYLQLKNHVDNFMLIKYVDLLSNPKDVIQAIADKTDAKMPVFFKNTQYILSGKRGKTNHRFHTEHYLEGKWKKNLTKRHVQQINGFLDEKLMEELNYTIL